MQLVLLRARCVVKLDHLPRMAFAGLPLFNTDASERGSLTFAYSVDEGGTQQVGAMRDGVGDRST